MGRYGELYAEGRSRFIEVVADAGPDTPVPTCPAWTVKDVLAHVAGIPADILAGNLDGVATDAWTQSQVDARRDRSIAEISDEWRETGPQIDAIVDQFGAQGAQLLFDLTSHEHDVRLALGRPGGRDAAVIDVANDFTVTHFLGPRVAATGAGTLEIRSGTRTWRIGDGEPAATLTAAPFDLMRALSGRRTPAQLAAMDWTGDPAPFLPAFEGGPFTFPPHDIVE
jgi:uncharacterized protein (TIGR03083 family)